MLPTPSSRIFHHVTAKKTSVLDVLVLHFRKTPEQAQHLIELGAIYHNKRRVFEDVSLPKGSYLRLHLYPKRYPIHGVDWAAAIQKEEQDYVLVHKPPGIPTHATVDNALENTLSLVRKTLKKDLFVTQRLDIPVSGLLLFAKTKDYQGKFNQWLLERKVRKVYTALVEKSPPLGLWTHYMEPNERSPKKVIKEHKPNWLKCELSLLESFPIQWQNKSLFQVKIELHTGRTHQIRAQLAQEGYPIWGDRLYGSSAEPGINGRIYLGSTYLAWPGGNVYELPPPYF